MQRLAAEIEEAVGEAQVLRIVRLAEHRNGQLLGRRQHLDLGREQLDLARRQLGVDRALGPRAHVAVDPDHPLRAHGLGRLERGAIGIGDDLRQAVVVAKVDEQQRRRGRARGAPSPKARAGLPMSAVRARRRCGSDNGAASPGPAAVFEFVDCDLSRQPSCLVARRF